jgi:hypothetical protein
MPYTVCIAVTWLYYGYKLRCIPYIGIQKEQYVHPAAAYSYQPILASRYDRSTCSTCLPPQQPLRGYCGGTARYSRSGTACTAGYRHGCKHCYRVTSKLAASALQGLNSYGHCTLHKRVPCKGAAHPLLPLAYMMLILALTHGA